MMLEAQSPRLRRRMVPVSAVHEQIVVARNFLATTEVKTPEQELLA
jgi:hypothetical protein